MDPPSLFCIFSFLNSNKLRNPSCTGRQGLSWAVNSPCSPWGTGLYKQGRCYSWCFREGTSAQLTSASPRSKAGQSIQLSLYFLIFPPATLESNSQSGDKLHLVLVLGLSPLRTLAGTAPHFKGRNCHVPLSTIPPNVQMGAIAEDKTAPSLLYLREAAAIPTGSAAPSCPPHPELFHSLTPWIRLRGKESNGVCVSSQIKQKLPKRIILKYKVLPHPRCS